MCINGHPIPKGGWVWAKDKVNGRWVYICLPCGRSLQPAQVRRLLDEAQRRR